MKKQSSYGIRVLVIAGILLAVYLAAFFLFVDMEKAGSWIGFGFSVLSLVLTGGGLWFGVTSADSLQTAANFEDTMYPLWLYPVLTIGVGIIGSFLPGSSWRMVAFLEILILALAAVFAIAAGSAALRMTELDREGKRRAGQKNNRENEGEERW